MEDYVFNCCICGKETKGMLNSNNPWPIKDAGECCPYCNITVVIPARFRAFRNQIINHKN